LNKNWPRNKANEVEVSELPERSSKRRSMKLKNNIVTMRKVEVLRKDKMEEEDIFPEEEEEEELEEV
jgi:hypothetical protein